MVRTLVAIPSTALAVFLGATPLPATRVSAAVLSSVLDGIRWGEGSDELARHFGSRAIRLSQPIEFGDSYVDVALRNQVLGGFPFTVYFQMDKGARGLKRVMFERQRHGANPRVFRAVLEALDADYGPPARICDTPAAPRNGYQGRASISGGITTISSAPSSSLVISIYRSARWGKSPSPAKAAAKAATRQLDGRRHRRRPLCPACPTIGCSAVVRARVVVFFALLRFRSEAPDS
jgi:hypothetical protein